MLLRTICLAFCLSLLGSVANAAQDDDLQKFFSSLNSLKADFSQRVYGPRQELLQNSQGEVIIQRPGKFRWDYQQPYQQHIVADGSKVWLYDVDLEQVTIKPQDETMSNTPASLLSEAGQLNKQFDVIAIMREGKDWFELIPKDQEGGYETLFVAMENGVIREMELKDSFGQFTRLEFNNVIINQDYNASTFQLAIPEGVDVIDETAR